MRAWKERRARKGTSERRRGRRNSVAVCQHHRYRFFSSARLLPLDALVLIPEPRRCWVDSSPLKGGKLFCFLFTLRSVLFSSPKNDSENFYPRTFFPIEQWPKKSEQLCGVKRVDEAEHMMLSSSSFIVPTPAARFTSIRLECFNGFLRPEGWKSQNRLAHCIVPSPLTYSRIWMNHKTCGPLKSRNEFSIWISSVRTQERLVGCLDLRVSGDFGSIIIKS